MPFESLKVIIIALFLLPMSYASSEVDQLLSKIESSEAMFERNGRKFPGDRARQHLERKWNTANRWHRAPTALTTEDFINEIASYSRTSGRPYLIHLPCGKVSELGPWLENQIQSEVPGES